VQFIRFLNTVAQHRLDALAMSTRTHTQSISSNNSCSQQVEQEASRITDSQTLVTPHGPVIADTQTNSAGQIKVIISTDTVDKCKNREKTSRLSIADNTCGLCSLGKEMDADDGDELSLPGQPSELEGAVNINESYRSSRNTKDANGQHKSDYGSGVNSTDQRLASKAQSQTGTSSERSEVGHCDRKRSESGSPCTDDTSILDLAVDLNRDDAYMHWRFCDTEHAKFDLSRLLSVLCDILDSPQLKEIDAGPDVSTAMATLKQIKDVLGVEVRTLTEIL